MKLYSMIKNALIKSGEKADYIAQKAEVTDSYISKIVNNKLKTPPAPETIIRIADALNMSEKDKKELIRLAELERTPAGIRAELERLQSLKTPSSISNAEIITSDLLRVPVFSHVYAGVDGCCNYPEPIEYIDLPIKKNGAEIIAIKVKGDSMEPRLYEGDLVVVKMGIEPNNKEPGVFFTSTGDTVVKIYNVLADGRKVLTSLNPLYPPITDDFHIVGKVWKVLGGW